MSFDVFFYEAFAEEAEAIAALLPSDVRAGFTWKTVQEHAQGEPEAPLVSVRTQSVLPQAWAGLIDAVLTRSTGYDHVLAFRQAVGLTVPAGYLPDYCARAVAEQCMLMWTALLRKLPRQVAQFGRFGRDGLTGRECLGKTVLVVGVGNIGSEVVKIAEALGMTALGVDLVERHGFVTYTTLVAGLGRADVIVCAMNLTAENGGYFSYDRLKAARRGAIFINCARGELAPAAHLLGLLEAGVLAGVGLDVYEHEPLLAVAMREGGLSADGPPPVPPDLAATLGLVGRDDVIATPHNAFNTAEALDRKAARSVESAVRFLREGTFPNPVPEGAPAAPEDGIEETA